MPRDRSELPRFYLAARSSLMIASSAEMISALLDLPLRKLIRSWKCFVSGLNENRNGFADGRCLPWRFPSGRPDA